ncbi:MAG: LysE/ArgO family amino acid transporter [Hoeflea sp.]|uniref:LysE/ArgO family amino acid transporter n=1 Tax=Hoeflea sp. TaxID=1940281 RepID=UPI001D216DA9|nr:LysE/ArgO family amino acid transporter [Hoeflea sp.]MBU4528396.1 LysE/ArgO family amino acid transporter [Alphaproteobacteria bacterium]MBU4543065.1 LysE/ArgO family amino acid transporter [Alphaproteobacteria bacterium]MBU4551756.1 LysE/ArgO family amino acid transporter [Alphaproteobacteria bacterium]MBV1723651.1 LysE/ArgO family amino acid transporter [Hoeflea sp.]MBV1761967.1 LysE/ArgO family amino acid transporter [Hoeflea sp.]
MSPLLAPAIAGLLLGGSLIIAIGAQNAFILRQGLLRQHVFILCLICALSDAALIGLGVAGLGAIISSSQVLIAVVTLGGAAFLAVYAVMALRRALRPSGLEAARTGPGSLKAAVLMCLAFTFLNPHVYLDTVLLVGGLSARYEGTARLAFAIGAMSASFLWFFGLGYGARVLEPLFKRPSAWRVLDGLIAAVMALLSASLMYRFFTG